MSRHPVRVVLAIVVMSVMMGCGDNPKVIPVSKMVKIYREMFLADQWVQSSPIIRSKADTTWLYKPIIEKYGYSMEDYYFSVDNYLNDPGRYSDLLGKVASSLEKEAKSLAKEIEKEEALREKADSIADYWKNCPHPSYVLYGGQRRMRALSDTLDTLSYAEYQKELMYCGRDTMFKVSIVLPEEKDPDTELEEETPAEDKPDEAEPVKTKPAEVKLDGMEQDLPDRKEAIRNSKNVRKIKRQLRDAPPAQESTEREEVKVNGRRSIRP